MQTRLPLTTSSLPSDPPRHLNMMPGWQRAEVIQAWFHWRERAADPWRSALRAVVSTAVNTPMIRKTHAKVSSLLFLTCPYVARL